MSNNRKIGSERINVSGYAEIKVSTNVWELKHRVIYKKYKGEIPPGHLVMFADKNKRNFDIDNLLLISRKQHMLMIRNNLINDDATITKTGANLANLILKIGERKNE